MLGKHDFLHNLIRYLSNAKETEIEDRFMLKLEARTYVIVQSIQRFYECRDLSLGNSVPSYIHRDK